MALKDPIMFPVSDGSDAKKNWVERTIKVLNSDILYFGAMSKDVFLHLLGYLHGNGSIAPMTL